MLALSMFGLGIFIGTIVTIAVSSIKDWSKIEKILSAIFTATFAGVILAFIKLSSGKNIEQAATYYPIGLFYGLLFYYARAAMANIAKDKDVPTRIAGGLHILGLILAVGLGIALMFFPTFRERLPKDEPVASQPATSVTNEEAQPNTAPKDSQER